MRHSSLTLVVETSEGTLIRRISDATPLPDAPVQGYAAEHATRSAAATWGLPDFVFRPQQQRSGTGVRELGDGILLVGRRAAVLQVKSRTDPTADDAKETSWLAKNIDKARRQAQGTVRQLTARPARLTNARGRAITVAGNNFDWICVVIVDHLAAPTGVVPPQPPGGLPTVVLLRRDWEFLFDHLRSTRAVVSYLARVAGEPLELGREPSRYHEYALADINAERQPLHPALAALALPNVIPVSSARAPLQPAGHDDLDAHLLLRIMMEDIAETPTSDEESRLQALAELDGLPVDARTELGHTLLGFMDTLAGWNGEGTRTETRVVIPNPGDFSPLLFMVASSYSELAKEALSLRMQLLHYDYHIAAGNQDGMTVAVMLTPSAHPRRLWDTTLKVAQGNQGHSPEQVEELRSYIAEASLRPRTICSISSHQ